MANTAYRAIMGVMKRLIDWGDGHHGDHVGATLVGMTGTPYDAANPMPVSSTVVLDASEEHIGKVGGPATMVSQTPAITAGAYTAGDAFGGKLTFAGAARVAAGTGIIHSVVITDAAKQDAAIDLVLFDRDFGATADNAPFDPSDADLANIIGIIPISASDYADFNDNSAACVRHVGMVFKLNAGTSMYGQMVIRDGDTYAATTDVSVKILVLQD